MGGGAETARRPHRHRSASRLGAVQALYQMELAETGVGEVLEQFSIRSVGGELRWRRMWPSRLRVPPGNRQGGCTGTTRHRSHGSPSVWRQAGALARLDAILRAILRAGAYEIMFREDVPAKVVISEYLNVAHAFFEREEPSFVNGVLDKLARSPTTSRL